MRHMRYHFSIDIEFAVTASERYVDDMKKAIDHVGARYPNLSKDLIALVQGLMDGNSDEVDTIKLEQNVGYDT